MKDVWLWLQILVVPVMQACVIAKAKLRPRRPWPTKERVAAALELGNRAAPARTKAPRLKKSPPVAAAFS
jgi:hypothetical protein